MPRTLAIFQLFGTFLCGVSLAAILHGALSSQPHGVWLLPGMALLCAIVAPNLEDDISAYGWLCTIAILMGVGVWSL
jgi:hypothetical protein